MAFLVTSEIDDIRTAMEGTLPDTCTIAYVTRTNNGAGGWTEGWTNRGTAIACRLMPGGGYSGITQEKLQEGQTWSLSLHWDQAIEESDKVTISGNDYQVQQINVGESEIFLRRVSLIRWE